MDPLTLTLVRHGETEGQSSIRYHGRTDVPLSARGRQQMQRVRDALHGAEFAGVYASSLCRAREAAQIIGRPVPVTLVAGFDEIDFGAWEGLTAEEIETRDPCGYAQWRTHDGEFHYPGGESIRAFRERVVRALHDVLAHAPNGSLLFVVHKGVIRSVLAELLRPDVLRRSALVADLGSIHVVRRDHGGWSAAVLDRTDHL